MSRWVTHLAVGILLVVAVSGIAAVVWVPGDAASKTAIALGVVAAIVATGSYATNLDVDEVGKDIRRLRQIAEDRAAHVHSPRPERLGKHRFGWLMFGAAILWFCRDRRGRRR